ncbi:single-stranded DNA-binding protein, partial [Photobacterium phosphoreum]|nr:single-stranded DNA-binding protein [Photobacterium phosphoreum]
LKPRKWQDKDTGADLYSTDIVADQMQMLGGREGGDGGGEYNQAPAAPRQQRPAQPRPAAPQASPGVNLADMDDDVPF